LLEQAIQGPLALLEFSEQAGTLQEDGHSGAGLDTPRPYLQIKKCAMSQDVDTGCSGVYLY